MHSSLALLISFQHIDSPWNFFFIPPPLVTSLAQCSCFFATPWRFLDYFQPVVYHVRLPLLHFIAPHSLSSSTAHLITTIILTNAASALSLCPSHESLQPLIVPPLLYSCSLVCSGWLLCGLATAEGGGWCQWKMVEDDSILQQNLQHLTAFYSIYSILQHCTAFYSICTLLQHFTAFYSNLQYLYVLTAVYSICSSLQHFTAFYSICTYILAAVGGKLEVGTCVRLSI